MDLDNGDILNNIATNKNTNLNIDCSLTSGESRGGPGA